MNIQFCSPPTGFGSPYAFTQGQGPAYVTDPQYVFSGLQYMYGYQTHRPPMMADRGGVCDGKTESKPRLSKEEVEKLEKVFQENPKPSSSVKAQLADGLGLERPRINNWFQNRRAKAKQERKQEEYHARTAAEKSTSEPSSPDEDSSLGLLDTLSEGPQKRTQPSSAAFPDVSSPQITDASHEGEDVDEEEDDEEEKEETENENNEEPDHDASSVCLQPPVSTIPADINKTYHSPISVEFSQSEAAGFSHTQDYLQSRSMSSDFGMSTSPLSHGPATGDVHVERSMSSDGHNSQHYASMHHSAVTNLSTRALFYSPVSNSYAYDMTDSPFDASMSPDCHNDQASHIMAQGMSTPTDSFRSPPPPANLASRRNIPRPATLQAASLRSRSFNLPKTALDAPKRLDISSPVASIRRISSATGINAGRVQKCSAGPRSPFFGRAEALLQYHNRSPVGSGTPSFPSAAPPTPMTPALFEQRHNSREPAVISASSDDGSYVLGMGVAPNFVQDVKEEHDLKTPPTTPGMIGNFSANGFVDNTFGSGFNITTTDQPLLTPYLQSEFPELTLQAVPGYVETGDASPSTPLYANMISSGLEHHSYTGNAVINTQYDWDANESVVSSRASPGYPRSKQIQFTPNMTPQDYH